MTFDLSSDSLRSRIDRAYQYDDYWLWAFPDLQPSINYSLIVQDGSDGFACFIDGQNEISLPVFMKADKRQAKILSSQRILPFL